MKETSRITKEWVTKYNLIQRKIESIIVSKAYAFKCWTSQKEFPFVEVIMSNCNFFCDEIRDFILAVDKDVSITYEYEIWNEYHLNILVKI
jgi:hypothetical protein